jgi:signal transduction histidine kinase
MHQMILNLLDIGQLEEGKLVLHPEGIEAGSLARKACLEMEGGAAQRGVRLEVAPGSDRAMLRGDATVLRRVMDNLLANAIEHSPKGGLVTMAVALCDEGVEISVADQGPGVPAEFRERIFEKFQRLESRKSVPGANRGLGLTFCRLAVEAHGGTIWVDDAEGGGAIFRALLPATEAESGAESAIA